MCIRWNFIKFNKKTIDKFEFSFEQIKLAAIEWLIIKERKMTVIEAIEELKYDCNELGKAIHVILHGDVLLKMLMEWQYKHLKNKFNKEQKTND